VTLNRFGGEPNVDDGRLGLEGLAHRMNVEGITGHGRDADECFAPHDFHAANVIRVDHTDRGAAIQLNVGSILESQQPGDSRRGRIEVAMQVQRQQNGDGSRESDTGAD